MEDRKSDTEHWTGAAGDWIAWASTPRHDAFWNYNDALAEFVGPGHGPALEVGCGEGRISRILTGLGYEVTATDPVPEMLAAARKAGSAAAYAQAPGHALPFDAGRFPLVMAYNVLMDVDDLAATLAEIRRVMTPDGTLIISLVHPLADYLTLQRAEDATEEQSYFRTRYFSDTFSRDGLTMHFAGWARPLSAYVSALAEAGLAVTALQEPPAASDNPASAKWTRLPLFLWMKARPLS